MQITCVSCLGAFFIYILFLLVTAFGVSITHGIGDLSLERTCLLLVCGSYSLTGCLDSSLGSSLPHTSCLMSSCMAWDETLTASLLAGNVTAGRMVLSCLFCSDTAELIFYGKETDISLLILFWFTYPFTVEVYESSAGIWH